MGRLLEAISGYVTAPGTTQTALTMSSGDSRTVKSAKPGSKILLLAAWADNQGAGTLRIFSSRMHDAAQGLRLRVTASEVDNLLPEGAIQKLFSNDSITIDLSGSATAGDVESAVLLFYYEDIDGHDSKLITHDELQKRGMNEMAVENTLALGTGGGWTGAEAINVEFDQIKADAYYALAGFIVDGECAAVAWRGPDTANARVAGPGNELDRNITKSWFVDLARRFNMALIPVFNGNNKGTIQVDGMQDENGTDVLVNTILVELAKV